MNRQFMPPRDLLEKVHVSKDERRLGDNAQPKTAGVCEDFQEGTRDELLPFQGLEGVRCGAQSNLGSRLQLLQFLCKKPRGIFLEIDLVFKVFGCELKKLVGKARVAVSAGELAPSIGIDGVGEGQSSFRGNFVQNGARRERLVFSEAAGRVEGCVGGCTGQTRDLLRIEDGEEGGSIRHLFAFLGEYSDFFASSIVFILRMWIVESALDRRRSVVGFREDDG